MVTKVKQLFGYDDSLDAFGVHGAGGTLGALLTGVFATNAVNDRSPEDGQAHGTGGIDGTGHRLLNQLSGVAIAWGSRSSAR